jgi:hypothetical protein
MEIRKSASLTVFYFHDNLFYKLVQNAQVNLQHCHSLSISSHPI